MGEKLYPNLTLIDGIYSLEYGPMHMGHAYREDIIIAGRDMYSCDCIGAYLMGFDPECSVFTQFILHSAVRQSCFSAVYFNVRLSFSCERYQ